MISALLRRRAFLLDGAVAVAFTVFSLVVGIATREPGEQYGVGAVVTTLVVGGVLAFRRVAPAAVLAVTIAGLAVYTFAGFSGGPVYLAPLLPLYTIAAAGDRRRLVVAIAATTVAFLAIAIASEERSEHLLYLLAFAGWVGGAVFLGTTQHNRRAYLTQLEQRARDLEDSREEEARRRVAEERLRIARDLHDVIAHGIATIHMQSSVALHVLDRQPEQARPALAAVKGLSKQTLNELRATLDVLRADEGEAAPLAPTPGIERLGELVDITRQAGLPVDMRVVGEPVARPAAVDVAAYRIVQESLTNVMRHAGERAAATVTVMHGDDAVEIEVVDDGLGAAAGASANGGHGIVGMRERAATVGGAVSAAARPGGGFRVHARLPYASRAVGAAPPTRDEGNGG